MNRRCFTKTALAAVSLAAYRPSRVRAEGAEVPPNLLIIQTDEHNLKTLGCYRNHLGEGALVWGEDAIVDTPNIDWIANNGAMATQAYANTPVCSPSRSCWMSGRYPHRTPVEKNDIPMDSSIITFAEVLRRNGYATGYSGKWHLDGAAKPGWAPQRNFGFEDNRYMFNRGHWKVITEHSDGTFDQTYSIGGANEENFTTDFLADRTIDFIEANKDRAFCYMVSIPDPHGPDSVRAPYDTMFTHIDFQKPPTSLKDEAGLPSRAQFSSTMSDNGMAQYLGMVACIDENVGRILRSLEDNGILQNTVIVFTADHGDLLGEHHRKNKGVPYDGSAKIPLLIYYPEKIAAGKVVDKAFSCTDFAPTILSMLGVDNLDQIAGLEMDGRDASYLFDGTRRPSGMDNVVYLRGTARANEGWIAAVNKRYKLVYGVGNDEPWLFDLKKDPDELKNYYDKPRLAGTRKNLAAKLLQYLIDYDDPYLTDYPNLRAKLEADVYS